MKRGGANNHYTSKNKVEVLRGGAEFFARLEALIDAAVYSVILQTYIFDPDETGTRILNALKRAAGRKVLVYVLVDGYASSHLTEKDIQALNGGGVRFSFFAPGLKSRHFYFGRRLHHKVAVADGYMALVSGANISNRYNDMDEVPAWLDWAVYVEGEAAGQLNLVCIKLWDRSVLRKRCKIVPGHHTAALPQNECLVRIRRNDWVYEKTQITRTYRELFQTARKEVTVMTSYFWPPQRLLKRMAWASKRGVRIRLILTGRADVPFAKYTERYLYPWLFRNNVEVYEYQNNILHGKIAVCDNEWITVGSYNVNHISAFASIELNLDIKNDAVASEVNKRFDAIIEKDCLRITQSDFKATSNYLKLFFYYLSYRIVHLVFYLFTFYFVQKKSRD
jgi:cardiolipin synthase